MSTVILSRKDVRKLLSMKDTLQAVERAFREWYEGGATMPPKAYLVVEKGDFRAMPAALPHAVGIKWVNAHTQNSSRGLPTVMAVMIYSDPETGYPLAVMDATEITSYRTGAAAAIASKYLAKKNSRTLGIVGAGYQAGTQLMAHEQVFNLDTVKVFDVNEKAAERFINSFPEHSIRKCSLEETAASDIVCTLTPVREPLLKREWILPGTHINAVGADAPGKEELDPLILKDAVVVVDDPAQAVAAGEINVPLANGLFSVEDIYATLGEIITGHKQGRVDDRSITVFDSTGVAIEDIALAEVVYEKAIQSGGCLSIDLVDTA